MALWRSRPPGAPAAPSGEPPRLDQTPPPGLVPAGGLADPMQPAEGEMPFLDHLEELRWRIIKGIGAIALCALACLFFADAVVDGLLMAPTRTSFFMYDLLRLDPVAVTLQNRTITGQFFAYFGTVLATGLILGSPFVLYQAWKFIEPGLYAEERQGLRFASVFATFFFVLGIAFGYLVLSPIALQFFAKFQVSESIVNEFDIAKYFSMLLTWTFGAGLLFELPVVVSVLARIGVLTEVILKGGRKYALIVILVLAGLFTPPDPLSQIILAVPMVGLYELSIVLTRIIERRRRKAEALAAGRTPPDPTAATEPPSLPPGPPASTEHSVAGAVAGALAGAVAGAAAGLEAARHEDEAHDAEATGGDGVADPEAPAGQPDA